MTNQRTKVAVYTNETLLEPYWSMVKGSYFRCFVSSQLAISARLEIDFRSTLVVLTTWWCVGPQTDSSLYAKERERERERVECSWTCVNVFVYVKNRSELERVFPLILEPQFDLAWQVGMQRSFYKLRTDSLWRGNDRIRWYLSLLCARDIIRAF